MFPGTLICKIRKNMFGNVWDIFHTFVSERIDWALLLVAPFTLNPHIICISKALFEPEATWAGFGCQLDFILLSFGEHVGASVPMSQGQRLLSGRSQLMDKRRFDLHLLHACP